MLQSSRWKNWCFRKASKFKVHVRSQGHALCRLRRLALWRRSLSQKACGKTAEATRSMVVRGGRLQLELKGEARKERHQDRPDCGDGSGWMPSCTCTRVIPPKLDRSTDDVGLTAMLSPGFLEQLGRWIGRLGRRSGVLRELEINKTVSIWELAVALYFVFPLRLRTVEMN